MRITPIMMHRNSMSYLNAHTSSIDKYNTQLMSGKRVSNPSDDPISMTSILNKRRDINRLEQFDKNVSTAKSHLETTEGALTQITDLFGRINELVIQASNDTYDKESREAIATEILSLKDQLGIIANTKHGNYYIFGGTDTSKPPYDIVNDKWQANPKANTKIEIEVSEKTFVPINTDGEELFNGKGLARNLFDFLDSVVSNIKTGNSDKLRNESISEIQDVTNQTLQSLSKIGTNINRIDIIKEKNTAFYLNSKEELAEKEECDPQEVYLNLKSAEMVYKASLAVTSKTLQTSLLDFLR